MRKATVILKSLHAGRVRQIGRETGTIEELVAKAQKYAPLIPSLEIKHALQQSVWSDGPTWAGGKQIAFEVLELHAAGAAVEGKSEHLDEILPMPDQHLGEIFSQLS